MQCDLNTQLYVESNLVINLKKLVKIFVCTLKIFIPPWYWLKTASNKSHEHKKHTNNRFFLKTPFHATSGNVSSLV